MEYINISPNMGKFAVIVFKLKHIEVKMQLTT